jgi:hypothetical protein
MNRKYQALVGVLLLAAVLLTACGKAAEPAPEASPVQVEHLNGKEVSRVTLTTDAAKRLDLQTDAAQVESIEGAERVVVPYASVLYDTEGHTWVYAASDALTFVRTPVEVESINGDDVVLKSGVAAGTNVVTVGAEELFGSETEFEEE